MVTTDRRGRVVVVVVVVDVPHAAATAGVLARGLYPHSHCRPPSSVVHAAVHPELADRPGRLMFDSHPQIVELPIVLVPQEVRGACSTQQMVRKSQRRLMVLRQPCPTPVVEPLPDQWRICRGGAEGKERNFPQVAHFKGR